MRSSSATDGYHAGRTAHVWSIPDRFNIATACLDRHAVGKGRPALICVEADGAAWTISFDTLLTWTCRLANALTGLGAEAGDRVAILLPQSVETAIAHFATYRAGLIALPLFTLFGEEALAFRLVDSGARFLITDRTNAAKLADIWDQLPALERVLLVDGEDGPGTVDFWATLNRGAAQFTPVDTAAEDPALIIYTSGTTGQPKGALHAHRVLLGHLPGVEHPHQFFPQRGDRFWTPADWAWIGGLLDVLLPSLYHGVPVVANRMTKFDPEAAFDVITRYGVRNIFFPPTALKLMREAPARQHTGVRSIGSGGESLGEALLVWGEETFGVSIAEFYGQTECNLVVGSNPALFPTQPGAIGKAIPGHRVAILAEDGRVVPDGEVGQIAVQSPDPVMFLRYWNQPSATAAKFVDGPDGRYLLTGDTGSRDADGYFRFVAREDDVITSAGYRIGPGEIEDCLLSHPAVSMAAVVGVPDPIRTEIIKAVVVPKPGVEAGARLKSDLQTHVKVRLAAHEYPRIVEFRDRLPMTATGKIIRRALRD